MSKNVHFHCIKLTFFDITLYFSTTNDGRKTNNTSYECPTWWYQNTRRTAFQLYQGLSCNLFFRKCVFHKKGCVILPNRATQLFLTYFDANIQGFQIKYHLFVQHKWFSLKFTFYKISKPTVWIHMSSSVQQLEFHVFSDIVYIPSPPYHPFHLLRSYIRVCAIY